MKKKNKKKLYEKYKDVIDEYFGKSKKKASEVLEIIDKPKVFTELQEITPEEEWEIYTRKPGIYAKDLYLYKEERDIESIYNSHKNHSSIQIPLEAKKIVDYIKLNSKNDIEIIESICKWTSTYIDYDSEHAAASRLNKEGINLIYLNATETFNTRTGICGEKSLLAIGMLSYAGIPSTIYRPWYSHIAVISKSTNGKHYMCDATYNKFEEVLPTTEKESKESYYEIGVATLTETYKWNWEPRRDRGLEYGITKYGRELTPKELLDTERALLCEPLKYGTLIGILEQEEMIPTCKQIEEERKKKNEEALLKIQNYGQLEDYYKWKEEDWNEWEQWKKYGR